MVLCVQTMIEWQMSGVVFHELTALSSLPVCIVIPNLVLLLRKVSLSQQSNIQQPTVDIIQANHNYHPVCSTSQLSHGLPVKLYHAFVRF